jgi:hypothetical protein
MSRAEACGETLPRGTSGEFLNGGSGVMGKGMEEGGLAWDAAWRRGGPGGGRTRERRSQVAAGRHDNTR